ncbi:MAG: mechanosensitive ion channel domain-containing protein [Bacteroidota bacterium]
MDELFEQILFSIGNQEFSVGQVSKALAVIASCFLIYRILLYRLLPLYFAKEKIRLWREESVINIFRYIFILLGLIGVIWSFDLDYVIYSAESISFVFRLSTLLEAVLIFQIARLFDWIFSKILVYNYYRSRKMEDKIVRDRPMEIPAKELGANRSMQYVIYVLAIILILKVFRLESLFHLGEYAISITSIFSALLVLLFAKLLSWILTQLILYNYYQRNHVNLGSQYAINQLLKYIIYVFAFFMALEILGIQMTVLWGGAAALLVGVGLGLQQIFNDLISGVILLFEGKVEVGNVVQLNEGMVGTVRKIGLRTSVVETLENITIIVPNSKLIIENVTNWSHSDDKVRFTVEVGVAYGSDTQKVKELLIKIAKDNVYILQSPAPFVRFTNFGESALDFQIIFWSRNFLVIEDIKSDLRFEIDRLFREHKINIPVPQRDVWIRREA